MKIIITESQLKKLNEDITASRMIVYHRTGKLGFNPSKNIADVGYNIGKGRFYGYGVYTTYDLESQLNDNMKMSYGNIIIESQILDMSKFLIFNYDIAKKIYKSRYQFGYQLKQILGKKEWLKYKNNNFIKYIHNTLDEGNVDYTSKLARDFSSSFRDSILRKLNGMIFTGENDGNVLVVYNRRNIEPLRYSEDDGQTWTNVRNVKTYQRIKDSDEYKNNIEIQHILNKIENEGLDGDFIIKIPVKYQDYILTKIIDTKGEKLNYINIEKLLKYSDNKDLIATKIIDVKGEKLNDADIHYLLKYSDNKDDIATKIINIKGEKISGGEIYSLFRYSKDKELIKKLLLQNGIDYKLINDVIQMYNDNDTPYHLRIRLIPDNYQSMLQEIRRIKEIMI
jgi:hypothetical protein